MIEILWYSGWALALVLAAVEKHRETWRRTAIELDLHYSSVFPMTGRMHGVHQGFEVAVFKQRQASRSHTVVEVRPVDPGFTLRPETAVTRLIKPDVEVGEAEFDERVRIEGDAALALATLSAETRRNVEIVVVHGGGAVADGMIRSTVRSVEQAPSTLDSMLDLARDIRRPDDKKVPALLTQRALQASTGQLRLCAFQQLAASFQGSATLLATARLLGECSDVPLRLEALRVLLGEPAPEGAEAAEELARLVRHRQLDSSSTRRVLESLVGSAHREIVTPTLSAVLKDMAADSSLRTLALEGLVRAQCLDELLAVPYRDTEAAALARGLGRLGDVAAQPRLLQLLEHSDFRVRKAAAEALGDVGDLDAVAPLRQVVNTAGVLSLGLVPAAESAIAQIQRRLGGSQDGEISLVGVAPLEGAVSPAEEEDGVEGGEVSLTS